MGKRLSAKHKIDRRLGVNLWGRPKSPVNDREYGPGQHGQRRKKPTDFGLQLMAKQKLKGYYGNIGERQFRRMYQEASRRRGDTSENMIGLLERRLETVVYRAKFVPTVFAARQFINHSHIKVNDKSRELTLVLGATQMGERDVPDYIEADHKKMTARLARIPQLADVPYPVTMEPHLVVEFYSR